jgi:hypothetical protein
MHNITQNVCDRIGDLVSGTEQELQIGMNTLSEFTAAQSRMIDILELSKMPGASRVTYELELNVSGECAKLKSWTIDSSPIGDDRSYEILKCSGSDLI